MNTGHKARLRGDGKFVPSRRIARAHQPRAYRPLRLATAQVAKISEVNGPGSVVGIV